MLPCSAEHSCRAARGRGSPHTHVAEEAPPLCGPPVFSASLHPAAFWGAQNSLRSQAVPSPPNPRQPLCQCGVWGQVPTLVPQAGDRRWALVLECPP